MSFSHSSADHAVVRTVDSACAFALFLALVLFAGPVYAQGGRTCEYDLECPAGQACNEMGICMPRGSVGRPTAEESADDACGEDRRCRIDRLKRKNKAQRHARIISEERQVQNMLEQERKKALDDKPRLKDPWSVAVRMSRLGPIGMHGGYTFLGRIHPEFEFTYSPNLYIFAPGSSDSAGISGDFEGWWFRGGLSYFLLDSWFSPYLTAGFQVGVGSFYNFSSGFDFADFGTEVGSRFHAGEFGGGFDMQFKFGLQTRLGVVYRPLVYNQARIGPGQYDPQTRQGLADWYKRGAAVDVVWLLGWAF